MLFESVTSTIKKNDQAWKLTKAILSANPANIFWSSRRLEDVFKTCLEDVFKRP